MTPEEKSVYMREWRAKNKAHVRAYDKEWKKSTPKGRALTARFNTARVANRYKDSPKRKYSVQKRHAKERGIEWQFDFASWWSVWQPHWEHRGVGANQLVMARHGDTGPYSPENVSIKTCAENSREVMERRPRRLDQDAIWAIRGTSPRVSDAMLGRFWGVDGALIRRIRAREIYLHIPEEA